MDLDFDDLPVAFGKYKGMTPAQIANTDPSYLIWAYETFDAHRKPCTQALYEACRLDQNEEAEDDPSLKELDGILGFHK